MKPIENVIRKLRLDELCSIHFTFLKLNNSLRCSLITLLYVIYFKHQYYMGLAKVVWNAPYLFLKKQETPEKLRKNREEIQVHQSNRCRGSPILFPVHHLQILELDKALV